MDNKLIIGNVIPAKGTYIQPQQKAPVKDLDLVDAIKKIEEKLEHIEKILLEIRQTQAKTSDKL